MSRIWRDRCPGATDRPGSYNRNNRSVSTGSMPGKNASVAVLFGIFSAGGGGPCRRAAGRALHWMCPATGPQAAIAQLARRFPKGATRKLHRRAARFGWPEFGGRASHPGVGLGRLLRDLNRQSGMSQAMAWVQWLIGLARPENLRVMADAYGWVGYVLRTAIIFSETGLLIGFFLPGDSLLFATGFLASQRVFDIALILAILSVAAIVGDALNYSSRPSGGSACLRQGGGCGS